MRPVESTNRRRITSPSTFWSYSRGGYWIGESAFRATGGSWSGGTPGDPLPDCSAGGAWRHPAAPTLRRPARSEEHTSELQSRLHLVCRLLLEKKKKRHRLTSTHIACLFQETNDARVH